MLEADKAKLLSL